MTADAQGNDLTSVKYVVNSKIIVAPYDPAVKLTASMIAKTVADPITTLKDIFSKGHAVGLITSDGAPQDARDSDDATEFHQPGYMLNADPNLTLAFTVAEDNETVRAMTIGTPDADGVYHVSDTIQDSKWIAYQETHYKTGTIRRRLGVLQTTGTGYARRSLRHRAHHHLAEGRHRRRRQQPLPAVLLHSRHHRQLRIRQNRLNHQRPSHELLPSACEGPSPMGAHR